MKKNTLLKFIPLIVATLAVCSCNKTPEKIIEIEKTVIEQTYSDYVKNSVYTLSSIPDEGESRILVIPIWLSDSEVAIDISYRDDVRDDINAAYFGSVDDTGWQSVKSFYETESFGKITMYGTTTDWYETSYSINDVGNSEQLTISLVNSATKWYFNNHPEDPRTNYDLNKDGYLDGVVLIYGAPDYFQEGFNEYGNLWAYTYWLQGASSLTSPNPNAFFWASYDFMYGAEKALERTLTEYNHGDTRYCNVDAHTFIHETGHMFGLDDYYDYDSKHSFAGGFSMQDYNVGGHDPFSIMSLGWADPFIPTETGTYVLQSFQTTHQLILLSNSWNEYSSPFDEYVLLELYTAEGLNALDSNHAYRYHYPQGPLTPGIRVWHVNAKLYRYLKQSLTSDATKSGLVLAANNSTESRKIYPFYSNFHLLQLIRNNTDEVKNTSSRLSSKNLFGKGSSFSLNKFDKQFNGTGKMDTGKVFQWSFSVSDIYTDKDGIITSKISITKSAN